MTPLLASLEIFERATMQRLRAKSILLTQFLANGIARLQRPFNILTPDTDTRGCQLSLVLDTDTANAKRLHEHLIAAGVVCDWREPNVLRVALTPLYNTYKEAWMLIDIFRRY
jgi:kynureninase